MMEEYYVNNAKDLIKIIKIAGKNSIIYFIERRNTPFDNFVTTTKRGDKK